MTSIITSTGKIQDLNMLHSGDWQLNVSEQPAFVWWKHTEQKTEEITYKALNLPALLVAGRDSEIG